MILPLVWRSNRSLQVQVDPYLAQDKGNFLVLDGRDLRILYKIPPSKKRVRANRTKLRALLLQGLNVEVSLLSAEVLFSVAES
jgi:hypothetical protein